MDAYLASSEVPPINEEEVVHMQGVVVENGRVELANDLEVRPPGPSEVRVRVLASGLCRSDLLPIDEPQPDAMVLGHEASGVIDALGARVSGLQVGQRVAVSCPLPCNRCEACAKGHFTACPQSFGIGETPFSRKGQPVRALARVSSLAEYIVVDEFQAHPVHSLSPNAAALVGCAVSTGYGMTKNVVELKTGEIVIVFGVGGIGINSVQTARMLGAHRIIAVDINSDKERTAHQFGADDFVQIPPGSTAEDIVQTIQRVAGEGADAVIDCTGQSSVLEAAQWLLKPGGRLGLVGIPHDGGTMNINVSNAMYRHLTIRGALNGASNPFVDMGDIVQLAETHHLELETQVSHTFALEDYADAIDALRKGKVLRAVVEMPSAAPPNRSTLPTPIRNDGHRAA
ncbi:zinc-binding dehydrogenase [Microbacterium sp. AGC85]